MLKHTVKLSDNANSRSENQDGVAFVFKFTRCDMCEKISPDCDQRSVNSMSRTEFGAHSAEVLDQIAKHQGSLCESLAESGLVFCHEPLVDKTHGHADLLSTLSENFSAQRNFRTPCKVRSICGYILVQSQPMNKHRLASKTTPRKGARLSHTGQ